MAPPIAKATLQSALINAASNALAQAIKAYRAEKPLDLDLHALLQFTTAAFVLSPLTFLWLDGLESSLPGVTHASKEKEKVKQVKGKETTEKDRLNMRNTIAKVVIDQVVGGAWNTVLFIVTIGTLRGEDWDAIRGQVEHDFYPIMIAGFKLWPLVSILNFTTVPADKRQLVGSLFGVIWAVYLSLMSG